MSNPWRSNTKIWGLLLDLLATGDTAETTRAFTLFTQLLDQASGHGTSQG
jgi:hypothetical protein